MSQDWIVGGKNDPFPKETHLDLARKLIENNQDGMFRVCDKDFCEAIATTLSTVAREAREEALEKYQHFFNEVKNCHSDCVKYILWKNGFEV